MVVTKNIQIAGAQAVQRVVTLQSGAVLNAVLYQRRKESKRSVEILSETLASLISEFIIFPARVWNTINISRYLIVSVS